MVRCHPGVNRNVGIQWHFFLRTRLTTSSQIAADVAEAAGPNRSIIVDAFCGVGGNTIAFALSGKWKRVYAIEKDPATLECAKINAEIYGVSGKITWFLGDCFELLSPDSKSSVSALRQVIQEFGIIFASPPWGGKFELPPHCGGC